MAHTMVRSAAFALGLAMIADVAWAQMAPPKVFILVGPPGSGKTTQARLLSKKYDIPAFSMSDLLKKEMASRRQDAVSRTLAAAIASGDVLPDDAATNLIRLQLLRGDMRKGFILDGYPATAGQAKSLDVMLQEQQLPKAVVVVLDAPDEVIRKRMLARKRVDDKPETIDRRIREFRNEAALLVGWAGQTSIVRVNATGSVAEVSSRIASGLEELMSKRTFATRP